MHAYVHTPLRRAIRSTCTARHNKLMRDNTNRDRICAAYSGSRRPHQTHPQCGAMYAHIRITKTRAYTIARLRMHAQFPFASRAHHARGAPSLAARCAIPRCSMRAAAHRSGWVKVAHLRTLTVLLSVFSRGDTIDGRS